jgi:hypothetical protein
MRIGHRAKGESFENQGGGARGLRARHRAALLVASAGLLVGSVAAVAGPTAAVAAKSAVVHTTALGRAASSHLTAGALTLHAHTTGVFSAAVSKSASRATTHKALPKLGAARGAQRHTAAAPTVSFPTVSCAPRGPGCDAISSSKPRGATTNPLGLAATANGGLFGFDIEPPDQGLCAGNGFVIESINIGEIRVFNGKTLQPVSGIIPLDTVMGLTGAGYSSGGDISCLYDADNGGHWIITEIVSTTSEASGGVFAGCFVGVTDTCREGIAVSTNNNPLGTAWNTYFLDPNVFSPGAPGAGHLLNDYGKIGNTRDALLFFYDEFNLSGTLPSCPAFGCVQFNGAQEFAIQKSALELGYASANLVHENMGTDPSIQPPDGKCFNGATAGVTCWYQVIPASSPSGQFDNNNGGTGFMAATLDFNSFAFGNGTGDNRAAVFHWTGLSALNSGGCGACAAISFGGQLFTGLQPYTDSGQACPASLGNPCGLAAQRGGTLDLGTWCKTAKLAAAEPCAEQGIATNGDGVTQVSYSAGQLWFAISTLINQTFGASNETHVGAAYWVLGTHSTPLVTLTSQGYVAAAHEDLEFPTMVAGTGSDGALMSFTLSGNGGPTAADGGGFFPSSAYGLVTAKSGGLVSRIKVADLGQAPQDGFTEYQGLPGPIRPRWGDYGAGIFVPGMGFYFASEYIQYPNCDPTYWLTVDQTCGGTRDTFANFGTSVNLVK